ncbi:SMI1/KNR4 family protein [Coleofasciculus sp. G2-EDA-02]|uniref:SMI1/KNR4 family protein n=1 Tax=Coleofasciculus sp. G2-EDA-02 TaxID=3069529 RepID=UPI0032F7DAAE
MYLDNLKSRLYALRTVDNEQFRPCTEEEVLALEQQLKVSLPAAYREFLLWMGHSTGELFAGSQWNYKKIIRLQTGAKEILERNSFPEPLPDDAFIFWMHQGYQFMFFRLSEGDDPPVYYYHEGRHENSFDKYTDSFSEVLSEAIDESYA